MHNSTTEYLNTYIRSFLHRERSIYKDSYKIFKDHYLQSKDFSYIFKQRRELTRYKRMRLNKYEIEQLCKLIQDILLSKNDFHTDYGSVYFLSNFFNKSLSKEVDVWEWLKDKDSPMYSFEIFLTNLISTKILFKEFDKGIAFASEREKNIYAKNIKNIDNLTAANKQKILKYAKLENRQELLSYIMNENFIYTLDVSSELLHLQNISLMNKQKIIRSFNYYLYQLFWDKSLTKEDLKNKQRLDHFFRNCIKYFLDNEGELNKYYDETALDNWDKEVPSWSNKIQLPRTRKSKENQYFNFHDIQF